MLFENLIRLFLIIYFFQIRAQADLFSENKHGVDVIIDKNVLRHGTKSIDIAIGDKLKDELRESLTDFLKSELAFMQQKMVIQIEKMTDQQNNLTQQLLGVVRTQFSEKKTETENFMRNELHEHTEKYKEYIKNQFSSIENKLFIQEAKMADMTAKLTQQDEKLLQIVGMVNTQNETLNQMGQTFNERILQIDIIRQIEQQDQIQISKDYIKTQFGPIQKKLFAQEAKMADMTAKLTQQDKKLWQLLEMANIQNETLNNMGEILNKRKSETESFMKIELESVRNMFWPIEANLFLQGSKITDVSKKLTQQDEKLVRLLKMVNTHIEKLNLLSQYINQKKSETENFMKNEIREQSQISKDYIKTQLGPMQEKLVTQGAEMQKKLTQQDEKLLQIVELVNTLNEIFNNLSQNLNQRKSEIENFMENELQKQTHEFQEYINARLNSTCERGFLEQNSNFDSRIATNEAVENVEMFAEKLPKEAISQPSKINSNQWDSNFNCINNCGPMMDLPRSCEEAMSSNSDKNGIHLLKIENSELRPFYGNCKRINNQVYTVIQRREDGSVDFYRNWTEYKNGFGNLSGEFWIGLERLHGITKQHKHELHIWFMDQIGLMTHEIYDNFVIDSEAQKYKLTIGSNRGSDIDKRSYTLFNRHKASLNPDLMNHISWTSIFKSDQNGTKFSTFDDCNDNYKNDGECCAVNSKSAWWFNHCDQIHLNGPYFSTSKDSANRIGLGESLERSEMAIRCV